MTSYTLTEPCCGSAAFALHMLGARQAIVPYQGSKWRFRHALAAVAAELGFTGRPATVVGSDPGPWAVTLGAILTPNDRHRTIACLQAFAAQDPRKVFDGLQGGPVPSVGSKLIAASFTVKNGVFTAEYAAEHLFLQRLAFSGKAVGVVNGRWQSPGFNKTSAYGIPGTGKFGAVHPMIPSLIRTLQSYDDLEMPRTLFHPRSAETTDVIRGHPTLVYIDPPYTNSTLYPNGTMTPAKVIDLATAWLKAGAAVIISGPKSLADALPTWTTKQIYPGRQDTSPFRGKQEEWVTYRGPTL